MSKRIVEDAQQGCYLVARGEAFGYFSLKPLTLDKTAMATDLGPKLADDFLDRSAIELAALIRSRQVSSEEVVRGYLARIDRLDRKINAFVTVSRRRALRAARLKDAQIGKRSTGELTPFHGVPIGIKDLNIVRFTFTRLGSNATPRLILPFDDLTVAPLRQAGFIILGKTATSELGLMPVTEPAIHPPTRNPWALAHSAGGSSGGSCAAVSGGMLPVAQGNDGAGSIRIPASFCNLIGLKPSRGRVPHPFGRPDYTNLYTSGPIARTVDDAAAMLDVMSGVTLGKRHWAPPPPRPFSELARSHVGPLRVRYTSHTSITRTHPEVVRTVESVARQLSNLGHEVEEGSLPEADVDEFLPLWQHLVARTPLVRWNRAEPVTRWLAAAGRCRSNADIWRLHRQLEARFRNAFEHVDLWLTPTVAQLPPVVGAYRELDPAQAFYESARLGAFTAALNVSGLPAINVPAGFSLHGLPIGVQLAGRMFAEGDLLAVARQLEATPIGRNAVTGPRARVE